MLGITISPSECHDWTHDGHMSNHVDGMWSTRASNVRLIRNVNLTSITLNVSTSHDVTLLWISSPKVTFRLATQFPEYYAMQDALWIVTRCQLQASHDQG